MNISGDYLIVYIFGKKSELNESQLFNKEELENYKDIEDLLSKHGWLDIDDDCLSTISIIEVKKIKEYKVQRELQIKEVNC